MATYVLAQSDGGSALAAILFFAIPLAITAIVIAGVWKTFVKAGKPGWGALVPIYNIVLMLEIAGRPLWWIVLLLIPLVNLVVAILVSLDIAEKFGKSKGFGVGLAILGPVFYPILGFGEARFQASV